MNLERAHQHEILVEAKEALDADDSTLLVLRVDQERAAPASRGRTVARSD
jgi:hypothetical protein